MHLVRPDYNKGGYRCPDWYGSAMSRGSDKRGCHGGHIKLLGMPSKRPDDTIDIYIKRPKIINRLIFARRYLPGFCNYCSRTPLNHRFCQTGMSYEEKDNYRFAFGDNDNINMTLSQHTRLIIPRGNLFPGRCDTCGTMTPPWALTFLDRQRITLIHSLKDIRTSGYRPF